MFLLTLLLWFTFSPQHRYHFSDKQLTAILELLRDDFGNSWKDGAKLPSSIHEADAWMNKSAGASIKRYDGCIKCNQHVWEQSDKGSVCPRCQGSRYDEHGQPLEQVIHFPLKPRLEALLRDSISFREAVDYENHRPRGKHADWIAGMFDCDKIENRSFIFHTFVCMWS